MGGGGGDRHREGWRASIGTGIVVLKIKIVVLKIKIK